MFKFLTGIGNTALEFFISPPVKKFRWANLVFIILIFAAGFYYWGNFFSWFKGSLAFHDWSYITLPRFTFLKDAMEKGILPLHTANTDALGGITTRFMAVPDVILSPQILLLRYMNTGRFLLLDIALLYTLGFIGLLMLRRKYGLSPLAFTALFLLYNFNGHLLAHFAVGHFTWGASFLFSWFALFVLELIEGKTGWRWVAKFSILLFVILLQGGYHQFVWCILFMLFLAIFSFKNIAQIIRGVLFSLLLSMVRILPPFILLGKFNNAFSGGYHEAWTIINNLLHFQTVYYPRGLGEIGGGLTTWESTIYIGILGTAFLFYFGIWRAVNSADDSSNRKVILLPSLCLAFLSLDKVYEIARTIFPIPLLTGERIASRMVSLSLVILLVLAVIEFQIWLNQSKASRILVLIPFVLLLFEINDIFQNYILWSVANVAGGFQEQGYDASQWYVANDWGDTSYLILILIGFIVTVLSLAFLIYMTWREKRNQNSLQMASTQN
jgi:hypothetical protein